MRRINILSAIFVTFLSLSLASCSGGGGGGGTTPPPQQQDQGPGSNVPGENTPPPTKSAPTITDVKLFNLDGSPITSTSELFPLAFTARITFSVPMDTTDALNWAELTDDVGQKINYVVNWEDEQNTVAIVSLGADLNYNTSYTIKLLSDKAFSKDKVALASVAFSFKTKADPALPPAKPEEPKPEQPTPATLTATIELCCKLDDVKVEVVPVTSLADLDKLLPNLRATVTFSKKVKDFDFSKVLTVTDSNNNPIEKSFIPIVDEKYSKYQIGLNLSESSSYSLNINKDLIVAEDGTPLTLGTSSFDIKTVAFSSIPFVVVYKKFIDSNKNEIDVSNGLNTLMPLKFSAQIRFSQPVASIINPVTLRRVDDAGNSLEIISGSYSVDSSAYLINYSPAILKPNSKYKVTVNNNNIKAQNGATLQKIEDFIFKTMQVESVKLLEWKVLNVDGTDVDLTKPIPINFKVHLKFSKPMNLSPIENVVQLSYGHGSHLEFKLTANQDATEIDLVPEKKLEENTEYKFDIVGKKFYAKDFTELYLESKLQKFSFITEKLPITIDVKKLDSQGAETMSFDKIVFLNLDFSKTVKTFEYPKCKFENVTDNIPVGYVLTQMDTTNVPGGRLVLAPQYPIEPATKYYKVTLDEGFAQSTDGVLSPALTFYFGFAPYVPVDEPKQPTSE